jgi:hypothetical protein
MLRLLRLPAATTRRTITLAYSSSTTTTRLRSVEQAAREGSATGGGETGEPLRSPDAPADPPEKEKAQSASTEERDARIAHAGGGFGPAMIARNLAEQEGKPLPPRIDPTQTPPSLIVPSEPLPHPITEQLPHAARTLRGRVKEAMYYLMKSEEGGGSNSATRRGAAVEVAGDEKAIAHETHTQGMPPLGKADAVHKKLAHEMRTREGI